ncbi:hypothetical protein LTR08_006394 [Meristemomyces frigidus]|nr:hypothetical protein LTR08_006394 [Meristemomyces frigidus]
MYAKMTAHRRKQQPQKLLLRSKVPQKQCAIYDANATDSPLLILPPEIRNRIWRYVLAGGTIHMRRLHMRRARAKERGPLLPMVCGLQASPEEEALECKRDNNTVAHPTYLEAHQDCTQLLKLSMLRVCRQVHQEAALLPFQENDFVFFSFGDLKCCIEKLLPAQSKALHSITLLEDASFFRGARDETALFDEAIPNVTKVVVFASILDFSWPPAAADTAIGVRRRQSCARRLMQLRHLSLMTAIVSSHIEEHPSDDFVAPPALVKAVQLWTAETEKLLLEPCDKAVELQQRKEQKAAKALQAETKRQEVEEERRQRRATGRLRARKE